MGAVFWRLWRALAAADQEQAPYLQAMLVSLAGLAVVTLFNNMYYIGFLWLEIALAAALMETTSWRARHGLREAESAIADGGRRGS
jgi:hypothetical protein